MSWVHLRVIDFPPRNPNRFSAFVRARKTGGCSTDSDPAQETLISGEARGLFLSESSTRVP